MKKIYPAKDPDEVLKYGFNWTPRNIGTEVITTINITIVAGAILVLDSAVEEVPNARTGQGTTFILSGGVNGEMCELLLHVETDAVPPSVLEQTVYLPIRSK